MVLVAALMLLIAASACAQEDVGGWDKAKWGMTRAELSKIYRIKKYEGDYQGHGNRMFSMNPPKIRGTIFMLEFWFDGEGDAGKLIRVQLVGAPDGDRDEIFGMMVSKYGEPSDQDVVALGAKYIWNRGPTRIELTRIKSQDKQVYKINYSCVSCGADKL
ncbi:MAG: hypothetical protein KQJ78_19595 [Deltaproteobacteria bacterium]|nr:hypothetical protein [Deltaproteobacteria bacterium]